MKGKRVGIIGRGKIGSSLYEKFTGLGATIAFYYGRSEEVLFASTLRENGIDGVFLAIPTTDKGISAARYIETSVNAGIPIFTCEKGALAYHAHKFKKRLPEFGYSAAVGGGTMILPYLTQRMRGGKQEVTIRGVMNGTLNYIFDQVSRGVTLGAASSEAERLGFAEPGATNVLSLINGELADVSMKACVLHNVALSHEEVITPDVLDTSYLSDEELEAIGEPGSGYRLVISFTKRLKKEDSDAIHVFSHATGEGWYIQGQFVRANGSSRYAWLPVGVENVLVVEEGKLGIDGRYRLYGDGAGAGPTTSAMINEFASWKK